jgi:hypothetical protein
MMRARFRETAPLPACQASACACASNFECFSDAAVYPTLSRSTFILLNIRPIQQIPSEVMPPIHRLPSGP